MESSAGPARTVPIARPLPSGFGTLVETRIYSSPPFAKRVAVIPLPSSFPTASTMSKLLLILVVPQILGTPRLHVPRTPLARAGQGAGGPRHARSERGKGVAGGVGGITARSQTTR